MPRPTTYRPALRDLIVASAIGLSFLHLLVPAWHVHSVPTESITHATQCSCEHHGEDDQQPPHSESDCAVCQCMLQCQSVDAMIDVPQCTAVVSLLCIPSNVEVPVIFLRQYDGRGPPADWLI